MTKVLFIMGVGRSGSTILDNLLGELDGFFSLGELDNLFLQGLVPRGRCGCDMPMAECQVWFQVLAAALDGTRGPGNAERIVRWRTEIVRGRNILRLVRQKRGQPSGWEALDAYVPVLNRVYEALSRVTGARVLVDSSKRPDHGALLHLVDGIRPYFVHLVRDPRAVAYSRQRLKTGPHGIQMARLGASYVASRWVAKNLASHIVRRRHAPDRSVLVRYEDFVADPPATVQAIAEFVGERPARLPFLDTRTACLSVHHTAYGNPIRFQTGIVELRADDEWRTCQRRIDRLVATAVSLPHLTRYCYPVLAGASALDA